MDYELLNEINDNDRREMEEYRIEEEEETMQKSTFKEGSIINGALGIYIPYNVVRYAIENGFNPSDEWKEQVKRAQEKGEDEEDYLTHNYEWIFDEMENAEDWLNAEIADDEHYFGTVLDGTDWGYWEVEEDWLSI